VRILHHRLRPKETEERQRGQKKDKDSALRVWKYLSGKQREQREQREQCAWLMGHRKWLGTGISLRWLGPMLEHSLLPALARIFSRAVASSSSETLPESSTARRQRQASSMASTKGQWLADGSRTVSRRSLSSASATAYTARFAGRPVRSLEIAIPNAFTSPQRPPEPCCSAVGSALASDPEPGFTH
jgi:hypothetical protein